MKKANKANLGISIIIKFTDKEKNLHKRNSILIKACHENINLFNNDDQNKSKSDYDKSFDYFFKNSLLENPKTKTNKNSEIVLPKIDHIFCIYVKKDFLNK